MNRNLSLLFVLALLVLAAGCTTTRDTGAQQEPATGSIEVNSTPAGSEIYLDGVFMGTTPMTIYDVQGGSHTLELRYRNYASWSKLLEITGGTRMFVDTPLSPVSVPASVTTTLPAPAQTTLPSTIWITMVTTNPTPVPTKKPTTVPTTSVPGTPAGCWHAEYTVNNFTENYLFELQPGGTGQLTRFTTREGISINKPYSQELQWSMDPVSLMVSLLVPNPLDPYTPNFRGVIAYDEQADDLLEEPGKPFDLFVRVPC
jgi:hypothetical protein